VRIFVATATVALLASAGVASGATYKGIDLAGGTIQFRGVKRHGRIVKVKGFLFDGVPMTCDEGVVPVTNRNPDEPLPAMRVKRERRFHGRFRNADDTQHSLVRGRFRRSFRRAGGIFQFDGQFDPTPEHLTGLHNCDTGETHFRVHRV
jgi:hypothetical protein